MIYDHQQIVFVVLPVSGESQRSVSLGVPLTEAVWPAAFSERHSIEATFS